MIRILSMRDTPLESILQRNQPTADVSGAVAEIIGEVRRDGDAALRRFAERFDGVILGDLRVSREEIDAAADEVGPEFLAVLREAAENIRDFHSRQVRQGFVLTEREGVVLGQKVTPIDRVGLYVPGGTAAYPSTVLMNAIPAKIAGCPEIVMMTPPGRDGRIPPAILAAARLAGVDTVFRSGGAQAVAAMAYGTESVPRVDKIVGPGNAYVAEAKRQVFGRVAVDMIAGPSEILVVADGRSDPTFVAADLLSQAEHDRNASAVLVTDSLPLAEAVSAELERQIPLLARAEIARASVDGNGKIVVAEDLEDVIRVANAIAPEHLELCVNDPFRYLGEIRHAGSVFLGRMCPEALGDYLAGPNHTLPTGGTARFSSPLSVDDFVKKTQFTYYTAEALGRVAEKVALFAEKEGLGGHARSARIRLEGPKEE